VGKDASSTGHPIVCHTDDSGSDTTDIRLARVPRKKWPKGSTRKLYNWADGYPRVVAPELSPDYAPMHGQEKSGYLAEIPQVPETWAYWDMDYGVVNEWGLAIGESTTTAKTVGFPATPDRPWGFCRAGIEDLSKIALERCQTARCAVKTMGKIAVDLGFYSADSGVPTNPDLMDSAEALAVADGEELWIFNVMTGKSNASAIWAAMRVPPNHVVAVGNSFTIRKMNLSDPENFLYSPGVTKLAEEMGWWSPQDDEPGVFDFMRSYGYTPEPSATEPPERAELDKSVVAFYSGRRMWRIFNLLSPAEGAKLDPDKGNLPETVNPYPSSVPAPHGSVTPRMLMDVLRDHYEGTPYDLTVGMAAGPFGNPNRGPVAPRGVKGIWERAISMHRTSWSQVVEASPHGRGIFWLGYDSPHGTAYLPFFAAAGEPAPESFCSHEGYMAKFSHKVAWWAFNLVNQYTDINFQLINADVREKAKGIEAEGEEHVKECFKRADAEHSQEQGNRELARCGNGFALKKTAEWWDFAYSLFAKYGRYAITHNESGNGMRLQAYPAWWLQSAEVGFTLWSAAGPGRGKPDPATSTRVMLDEESSRRVGVSPLTLLVVSAVVGSVGFQLGRTTGAQREELDVREPAGYVYLGA